ncbi:dihydrofolate reductase-like domain-containing protein [Mycena vulgaris]|nr:dihydrofolate reductase-like domain-containing protein [Mycena vulgaris]
MSESQSPSPPAFLVALLAPPPPARPHVTLTFAQSLDGKIAGPGGAALPLSGPESMRMTHWLRTMHDAILVGSGTALADDPQLNTRHLPPGAPHRAPRPIVLDRRLRLPPTCKLLKNFNAGAGRRPWVVAAPPAAEEEESGWQKRCDALTAAGARVLLLPSAGSEVEAADPTPALLSFLHTHGIRTLMVEGGARIIAAFFASGYVDTLLITTAPVVVGPGVGYTVSLAPEGMRVVETRLVGRDSVVALVRGDSHLIST